MIAADSCLIWDIACGTLIKGGLVTVMAFVLFVGSVLLLLAAVFGRRMGYLVAAVGFFGWMMILSSLWTFGFYSQGPETPVNLGPRGAEPAWLVESAGIDPEPVYEAYASYPEGSNWRVPGEKVPGVGGAMDLAFGVRNVFVAMNHVTNKGTPKILNKCTCPLTAPRCVNRIYTDMALIDVTPEGLVLREVAPGLDAKAVQAKTEAHLRVAGDCREMNVPAEFNGIKLSG